MRIILPYHLGSGNRGCEGIARGIVQIFQLNKSELAMYDITKYDFKSDKMAGLDEIGELRFSGTKFFEFLRIVCRILKRFRIPFFYNQLMSNFYISNLGLDDIVFITGGDIYCYEGAYVLPNLIVKKAKSKGIKTVLFGVSMEEMFLNDKVLDGLKNFDLIITRESYSSLTLSKLGLSNYLYPDPAFLLAPIKFSLPKFFMEKPVVGINLSPYTDKNPLFQKNIENLIKYIISKSMAVCLIPHVFWKNQDDRESMNYLNKKFKENLYMLDSENLNYLQIRYAISKCKYFIGGRTHSIISAYSTSVPCISLGYSVKSKGIAHDLGMPDYTVLDSTNLKTNSDLVNTFKRLENNIDVIQKVYNRFDDYIGNIKGLKELIL